MTKSISNAPAQFNGHVTAVIRGEFRAVVVMSTPEGPAYVSCFAPSEMLRILEKGDTVRVTAEPRGQGFVSIQEIWILRRNQVIHASVAAR